MWIPRLRSFRRTNDRWLMVFFRSMEGKGMGVCSLTITFITEKKNDRDFMTSCLNLYGKRR